MLLTVTGTQKFISMFTRYFPIQSRWISSLHFWHTAVTSIYILPSPLFLDLPRELLSLSCMSRISYACLISAVCHMLHWPHSWFDCPNNFNIIRHSLYVIQAESNIR
jgi:hypothetical protein